MMKRKRLLTGAVGALLAAAIAGGVAYATIPGPGNVYSACMLKGIGTIRLIDKSLPATNLMSRCTDKETEISWNQAGQPGPPGAPGTKGEPGAPGRTALTEPMEPTATTGLASRVLPKPRDRTVSTAERDLAQRAQIHLRATAHRVLVERTALKDHLATPGRPARSAATSVWRHFRHSTRARRKTSLRSVRVASMSSAVVRALGSSTQALR
jgi:hypothetical protein